MPTALMPTGTLAISKVASLNLQAIKFGRITGLDKGAFLRLRLLQLISGSVLSFCGYSNGLTLTSITLLDIVSFDLKV